MKTDLQSVDKVTIKMVSPAQATVERAESEAKHLKASSQKRKSQSLDRAPGVHYPNKQKKRKLKHLTGIKDESRDY